MQTKTQPPEHTACTRLLTQIDSHQIDRRCAASDFSRALSPNASMSGKAAARAERKSEDAAEGLAAAADFANESLETLSAIGGFLVPAGARVADGWVTWDEPGTFVLSPGFEWIGKHVVCLETRKFRSQCDDALWDLAELEPGFPEQFVRSRQACPAHVQRGKTLRERKDQMVFAWSRDYICSAKTLDSCAATLKVCAASLYGNVSAQRCRWLLSSLFSLGLQEITFFFRGQCKHRLGARYGRMTGADRQGLVDSDRKAHALQTFAFGGADPVKMFAGNFKSVPTAAAAKHIAAAARKTTLADNDVFVGIDKLRASFEKASKDADVVNEKAAAAVGASFTPHALHGFVHFYTKSPFSFMLTSSGECAQCSRRCIRCSTTRLVFDCRNHQHVRAGDEARLRRLRRLYG